MFEFTGGDIKMVSSGSWGCLCSFEFVYCGCNDFSSDPWYSSQTKGPRELYDMGGCFNSPFPATSERPSLKETALPNDAMTPK